MDKAHIAKATGRELPVSTKHCIEIGNFIRGKSLERAKRLMEEVIAKKSAVPMKRFKRDTGHKRGRIAAGRYPEKASKEILALLNSAEKNAENKGLNPDELFVKVYMANRGSSQWRYGRQRRRQMKRTNVEIILEEREVKKPKKKETPKEKKEAPKVEEKKVEPKVETKKEVPKEKPKVEEKKEAPKVETKKEGENKK